MKKVSLHQMKRSSFYLVLCLVLLGCDNIEYSPNQIFDKDSFRDINFTNLQRLGEGADDDTVRFVLTGDPQRSHNEVIDFYKKVNTMPRVDFVIVAGDISEYGVLKEMNGVAKSLDKLNVPYFAVVGNHDLTSRGNDVFLRMFGPLNYSFVYGGVKFICHDTNSREYSFNGLIPNIPWLVKETGFQIGVTSYVAVSHIPPTSSDFDEYLIEDYVATFDNTPGFLASFHGHNHSFEEVKMDSSDVPYITTSALGKKEFLLVEIVNSELSFERIYF